MDPSLILKCYCPQMDHGCCCICGQRQGYLGYSINGSWAHFQCALCVNGTQFNCVPTVMESSNHKSNFVHTGWDFKLGSDWFSGVPDALCYHCQKQGRCIECCWPLCHKQSHPACVDPSTEIFDISDKGCIWLCDSHSSFYGIKNGDCLGLNWSRWQTHHANNNTNTNQSQRVSVKVTIEENLDSLPSLQSLESLSESPHSSSSQPLVSDSSPSPPPASHHTNLQSLKTELQSVSNQLNLGPDEFHDSNSEQSNTSLLVLNERSSKKKQSLLLLCLKNPTRIRKLIMSRLKQFFDNSPFFVDSTNPLKKSVLRYLSRIDLRFVSTSNRSQIVHICEGWDNSSIFEEVWMINASILELHNRLFLESI